MDFVIMSVGSKLISVVVSILDFEWAELNDATRKKQEAST
jgi:hypothetical protein